MQSGIIIKPLKGLYLNFLARLTNLQTSVHSYEISGFYTKIRELQFILNFTKINKLHDSYVLVRNLGINHNIQTKSLNINHNLDAILKPLNFKTFLSVIRYIEPIHTQLRWKAEDLSIILTQRYYPLTFGAKIQCLNNSDIAVQNKAKLKIIDYNDIKIQKKLRIIEEIVQIDPYIRNWPRKNLLKIPITKKPVYKVYFSSDEIDKFKEIYAKNAKINKNLIQISLIYDKFNLDNYSSMKQNAEDQKLYCYLAEKQNELTQEDLSYLILGTRLDNKVTIKFLANLNKN